MMRQLIPIVSSIIISLISYSSSSLANSQLAIEYVASGNTVGSVAPWMELDVNGVRQGRLAVTANHSLGQWWHYHILLPLPPSAFSSIGVKLINPYGTIGDLKRTVYLRSITVNGTTVVPDQASLVNDDGGITFKAGDAAMTGAGSLTWPAYLVPMPPQCSIGGSQIGLMLSGNEFSWEVLPNAGVLDYAKAHGVTLVRVPNAWEKIQPTLFGPLDPDEVDQLKAYLGLASSKGIRSIIDIQNYARYNPSWKQQATAGRSIGAGYGPPQLVLGTADLPASAFVDFWSKLATALKGQPGIAGFDLMNEPHDLADLNVWPVAAQAAVNAIRAVGSTTPIIIEGNNNSSALYWGLVNPAFPLSDPSHNLIYSAHAYFDDDHSGTYKLPYDSYKNISAQRGVQVVSPFVEWVKEHNAKGYIGEFGVPAANDGRWLTVLDNFATYLRQNNIPGTAFYMSYDDFPGKENTAYVRQHYGNNPTLGVPGTCSMNNGADGSEAVQWSIIRKYTTTNTDAACWNR